MILERLYKDCDADCCKTGTQWSLIYILNGTILSLLFITYILFTIGSHVFCTRVIAAWLNQFLGCANFVVIILTGVLRYGDKGILASHCLDSAKWNSVGELKGDVTFQDDGELILVITICQIPLFFALCCVGSYPLRIKPAEVDDQKPKSLSESNKPLINPTQD